jgi:hypothetical protein
MILEVLRLENPDDPLCRRRHRPPATTPRPVGIPRPHGRLGAARQTTLARRSGMGSWTAVQSVTRRKRPGSQATTPVRGIDRTARRPTQSDRIPTREVLSSPFDRPRTPNWPAFRLVRAYVEPPAGIEPATPSLPWNHQESLCGPPFSQVTPDRRCQRYAFNQPTSGAPEMSWLAQRRG